MINQTGCCFYCANNWKLSDSWFKRTSFWMSGYESLVYLLPFSFLGFIHAFLSNTYVVFKWNNIAKKSRMGFPRWVKICYFRRNIININKTLLMHCDQTIWLTMNQKVPVERQCPHLSFEILGFDICPKLCMLGHNAPPPENHSLLRLMVKYEWYLT